MRMRGNELSGVKLYYLNVCSPLESEFRVQGDNTQVQTLFKKMPPERLEGFKSAKRAFYGCLDYPLAFTIPFMRGFRVSPLGMTVRAEETINRFRERVHRAFRDLGPLYDTMVEESRATLGENAPNFPAWEEVVAEFRCEGIALTLAQVPCAPGLMGLDSVMREVRREAYESLTGGFQNLVREMVSRLLEGKAFKDTSIEKFGQFLTDFSDLAEVIKGADYEGDMEGFKALVSQARDAMRGVVPDDLRGKDNANFRESVGNALNTVGRGLDNLMALPVGARRLNLGGTPPPPPPAGQGNLFGE